MTPEAIVLSGANGSGKTTFARQYLPVLHPAVEFLNADEIQHEGSPFAHRVSAGEEFLRRLASLEEARLSLAIEITLSSRLYVRRFHQWRDLGYEISLHFIELPSADCAVRRVEGRVAAGGHGVPEADVRRRFGRGLRLFQETYKPLASEWYHWFSDERGLRLVEYHKPP